MNGFQKHDIKHLSPYSINMYASCPGAWAARYIFKKKFKFGVAAQVGVLAEQVVQDVLLGASFDSSLEQAHKTFNKINALNSSEKELSRINDIKPMVELALEELMQYGEPEFRKTIHGVEQQRIEIKCAGPGWDIPVIGFLDFVYPKHGLIVDLKTTLRMPSVMSEPHKIQGAVYQGAKDNFAVKFLYVTPKKSIMHDIENHREILQNIKKKIIRMERFLSKNTAKEIQETIPVNKDSFYWSGEDFLLKELYGL